MRLSDSLFPQKAIKGCETLDRALRCGGKTEIKQQRIEATNSKSTGKVPCNKMRYKMSSIGVGKWKVTTIDCGWHIGNKVNLTPGKDDAPVKLRIWLSCRRTERRTF